ncbi:type II toxin-antitoxin system VapC family toxin [Umezawaea sp. NPDC059074]|uniref:type II toxin-antitoxin system VapC family toxin n=1 Tax=Umezawaea sp. NPDC059074 TaxID=3346716 RepID=UPI0036955189
MIYLDSCALVKLIRAEEHSDTLVDHVTRSSVALLSSELARVEVGRALTRNGESQEARDRAAYLLEKVARLPLKSCLPHAAVLPGKHLRSLDALHLATAQLMGRTLTQFITYDKRLAQAAHDAGLPVVTPGTTV